MSFVISPELQRLGLTPFFIQQLQTLPDELGGPSAMVARVTCERRGEYELISLGGPLRASLSGRLEHVLGDEQRPAVGDWVVAEPADPVARIHHLLERQSALLRSEVLGRSRPQTLAANIDLCCIVCALTPADSDVHAQRRALNPRRIERYLSMAGACRVPALVLINKADLLDAELAEQRLQELRARLPGVRALLLSALDGRGVEQLRAELLPGTSVALLGSSGVGKSSLINALSGESRRDVGAERSDDTRGRHTTTERQLLQLPNGALLVDTPGLRELALWADGESELASSGFDDIDELGERCRFRDCRHHDEPGCAVLAAVEEGKLSAERLEHAHKLARELAHQQARVDARLRRAEHGRRKAQTRAGREAMRLKRGE